VARDRKAEAARRDEKARAEGFTSYGQKYRASKRGYTGQGTEYNAALEATRSPGIIRRKSGGRTILAGPTGTKRERRALFAAVIRESKRK